MFLSLLKKWTHGPILAVTSIVATISLLELLSLGVLYFWADSRAPHLGATKLENMYISVPEEHLGWTMPRSVSYRARFYDRQDKAVYDVVYTLDEFGRRVVSLPNIEPKPTRELALFGCSFAFSNGLDDEHSLQHSIERADPSLKVINYGVHGYGPQQVLTLIESGRLNHELSPGTDALYLFFSGHLLRAIGSSREGQSLSADYYALNNGKLERHGSFWSERPLTSLLYAVLSRSYSARLFGIGLPFRVRDDDVVLVSRIISEAAKQYHQQTNGKLYVGFAPVYEEGFESQLLQLKSLLVQAGVSVVAPQRPSSIRSSGMLLPIDGHPNARFTEWFAAELVGQMLKP